MQTNKLSAGRGIAWFGCGWDLFKQYAAAWALIGIVFMLIALVCFLLPVIGPLIFMVLLPPLTAGLLTGADRVQRGSSVEVGTLFHALSDEKLRSPLLTLGAVFLGMLIVESAVTALLAGPGTMGMGSGGEAMGPRHWFTPTFGLAFLAALLMQIVIAMCMFLSIPLATFEHMPPMEAIKTSFRATAANILPFLLFAVAYVILAIIASLPFFLGFIVLIPIALCSVYCAYREIFE